MNCPAIITYIYPLAVHYIYTCMLYVISAEGLHFSAFHYACNNVFTSFQTLMNVSRNPQCVTLMQYVMILLEATSVHANMDILEMEKTALVCIINELTAVLETTVCIYRYR